MSEFWGWMLFIAIVPIYLVLWIKFLMWDLKKELKRRGL